MAGKGDRYRLVDIVLWCRNFDAAFSTCRFHPKYKAKRKPRADCVICRRLWREAQLRESENEYQVQHRSDS